MKASIQRSLFSLLIFSLISILPSKAQEFDINEVGVTLRQVLDSVNYYADETEDSSEGGAMVRARAMEAFWLPRANKNDSTNINMFGLYYKTLNQAVLAKYSGNCAGSGQFQGAWKCIGPDKLDKQAMGYVECIWADPDEDWTTTNGPHTLLAGTYGGLFKTVDGGVHWKCVTDNAAIANGVCVVNSIAVKPDDKNTIFLGMGGQISYMESFRTFGTTGLYGASILKTTDGGQTWSQELLSTTTITGNEFDRVQKIYFTPSGDYIIAFKNEHIFIRHINSTLWEEITAINNPLASVGDAAQWRDLEFVPNDVDADNHFFVASAHSLNAANAGGIYEVKKQNGIWSFTPIIAPGQPNNPLSITSYARCELSIPDNSALFAAFIDPSGDVSKNYNFSTNSGTYNSITGTALNFNSNTDEVFSSIGFAFRINMNQEWANCMVNKNGFITIDYMKIAGFGMNMDLSSASITKTVLGSQPNRIFVVQWNNAKRASTLDGNINFQIRLYETSNNIEIVYGDCDLPINNSTVSNAEVGLTTYDGRFFNLRTTSSNWAATTAANSIAGKCQFSQTGNSSTLVAPFSGLTFKWTEALAVGTPCIARFDMTTATWAMVKNTPNWNLNYLKGEFVVSPQKVPSTVGGSLNYNIYAGGVSLWQSYDGGQNFIAIGNGGSNAHDDVRGIALQAATNSLRGKDDVVFFATDGGVAIKPFDKDASANGSSTCEDISGEGLTCTNLWGFSTSEAGGLITAGGQHQGLFSYEPKSSPKWVCHFYADGAATYFDQENKEMSWATGWTAQAYYKSVPTSGRKLGTWSYGGPFPADAKLLNFSLPLFADDGNNHFVGEQHLYKKNNGVSTWTSLSDPNISGNLGLPLFNQQNAETFIRAYAFSSYETTNPIGYVVFERNSNAQGSSQLWYRNPPANNNSNNFIAKNAPDNGARPITDVTLDPESVNRVWVCMGAITGPSGGNITKDRVFYSEDGGTTWYDVSKGLPDRMPVTSIVFQEGSENVYCATDVGIFKCDFTNFNPSTVTNGVNTSVEWICFNDGKEANDPDFPNVMVTDLQINYCEGKLLACTYGRGIWETDILMDDASSTTSPGIGDIIPNPTEEITTNTTWSSDQYIRTGIHVSSGATLTISNSGSTQTVIHMPKNGKILVEPGSKLVVDGAKITNDCDGLWYGIMAEGQTSQPQTAVNQATVEIKNGAVIEHARFAIKNDDGDWWSHSGGIIKAENSTFRNNRKSIQFQNYYNINGGSLSDDASYVSKCTFEVNDDYKGDDYNYPFSCHISLWEVKGARIMGCEFYNNSTTAQEPRGDGIVSYNAGYTVFPHCSTGLWPCTGGTITRNTFEGFVCGINAESDLNYLGTVSIDMADFDKNAIGVRAYNMQDIAVLRSHFTVGNGDDYEITDCYQNAGTYTIGVKRFRIEENEYEGVTNSGQHAGWMNFGAVTENSEEDNEIYKNSFHDLSIGGLAIGKNNSQIAPSAAWKGLRYFCNQFEDNEKDIKVLANAPDGIATHQGLASGGSFTAAGNTFSSSTENISNDGHFIIYYYSGTNAPSVVSPNVYPAYTSITPGCTSKIADYPVVLTSTARTALNSSKDGLRNDLTDLISTYNSLVDDGNTQTLIDDLGHMNALDARERLLDVSPYLSETVLRYVIDHELLPVEVTEEVLAENPDVLRMDGFMSYLDDHSINTSALETAVQELSERTYAETEISTKEHDLAEAYRLLFADIKNDPTCAYLSDMPNLLSEQGTLSSAFELSNFYYSIGDEVNGLATFNAIPSQFELSSQEYDVYGAYTSVRSILGAIRQYEQSTLTADQTTTLTSIHTAFSGQTIGNAAGALLYNYSTYPRVYCVDMPSSRPSPQLPKQGLSTSKEITAFPNPAKDEVLFTYRVINAGEGLKITVRNINGTIVKVFYVTDGKGVQEWRTNDVPNGMYFYQLSDNKRKYGAGKVVIAR